MEDKNTAVFGIYSTLEQAERGVDALVQGRFSNDDISVLAQDRQGTKDFAHEKHTKAPEGATTGATAGGVLGGTLGLLAGIGALAIPGLGPFIAAGPIMCSRNCSLSSGCLWSTSNMCFLSITATVLAFSATAVAMCAC